MSDEVIETVPAVETTGATDTAENTVVVNDPTRANRPVDTWSETELKAAIVGELPDITPKQLSQAVKAYARFQPIDPAWTTQQVVAYFREGVEPAKTSNGVWVTDVSRAGRNAASWTTAELEAWALGEIQPVGGATDVKLAAELKKRLSLSVPTADVEQIKKAYFYSTGKAVDSGVQAGDATATQPTTVAAAPDTSAELQQAQINTAQVRKVNNLDAANVSYIDGSLDRYAKAVKPGTQISAQTGLKAQLLLDQLFNYVLNLEPAGFVSGMEEIRKYIAKNNGENGIFSDSVAYRFIHLLPEAKHIRERHNGLLTLLCVYAKANKGPRSQLDTRYLLRWFTPDQQDRLIDYLRSVV